MRAKYRMRELLNQGPFVLKTTYGRDEDTYGRKLRTISRDGRSLGDVLVDEGLADHGQAAECLGVKVYVTAENYDVL